MVNAAAEIKISSLYAMGFQIKAEPSMLGIFNNLH